MGTSQGHLASLRALHLSTACQYNFILKDGSSIELTSGTLEVHIHRALHTRALTQFRHHTKRTPSATRHKSSMYNLGTPS
eukprot:1174542-Amphidinium_carterae.1